MSTCELFTGNAKDVAKTYLTRDEMFAPPHLQNTLTVINAWYFWGFDGSGSEECRLVRCGVVWILLEQPFRKNPDDDDDDDKSLRNVGSYKSNTA
jgi:hypothetical protein